MGTLQALDEAALQLFIDKDDVHSLRIENEKLREKLRQFNQVDMKKSADLKVFWKHWSDKIRVSAMFGHFWKLT